jgi:hypothetical protein
VPFAACNVRRAINFIPRTGLAPWALAKAIVLGMEVVGDQVSDAKNRKKVEQLRFF